MYRNKALHNIIPFWAIGGIILWLSLVMSGLSAAAQDARIVLSANKAETSLFKNNYNSSRFYFSFDAIDAYHIETDKGQFTELSFSKGHYVGEPGAPKLPAVHTLIEIPFGADVDIKVHSYTSRKVQLSDYGIDNPLMPVQPSQLKKPQSEAATLTYNPASYDKSITIGQELASIEILGVLRGVRIARLTVAPVSYDHSQHILQVVNDIDLELIYTGSDPALSAYIKSSMYSPHFDAVYQQVFNAYDDTDAQKSHANGSDSPVKMLVISHIDFQETLRPFIAWQNQKGYQVVEAYTNVIGNTPDAIKAYIQSVFQESQPGNPAPTYLVLVGDVSMMPASGTGLASKEVTDLYYASVDGDYLPDMYYGRLSARNNSELRNQIDKIIYYQQYKFADPGYLDVATFIAGEDSFWNHQILQPTVKYATQNYYNANHGYSRVNAFLNNYTGSYNQTNVSAGIINYTGHCFPTEWYSPRLTAQNVHQMNNVGRYPLAIGNCCQSGLFSHSESIAEAWVRARDKGAVAYIGSAPDTHWFEDFYWSVGAFPIIGNNAGYVPSKTETTIGSFDAPFVTPHVPVGAIQFFGNLAITQANIRGYQTQSNIQWYWEGYHTFGDPSTVIYQTQGKENNVTHFPVIPLGEESFTIHALPGSYAAISVDGQLIDARHVGESGSVDLQIAGIQQAGTALIVVSKAQYIPYIEEITSTTLQGPYIVLDSFSVADMSDNQNGEADYGETISLNLTLKNIGISHSGFLAVSVSGGDDYITIVDQTESIYIPGLGVTARLTLPEVFSIYIREDTPNMNQAVFYVNITDGYTEWRSRFNIVAKAPAFEILETYLINDGVTGNGNGRLDPGETATLAFQIKNTGGAVANMPQVHLQTGSGFVSILNSPQHLQPLGVGNATYAMFSVKASHNTPDGTIAPISISVNDGSERISHHSLPIGLIPEITVGTSSTPSNQYPFYNLYQANRSQMIYLAEELGPGERIITTLGFFIQQYSSVYDLLPNFKIYLRHVDEEVFDNNFLSLEEAQLVFSADQYQMPRETGWHMWNIDDYIYDGKSNLLVEVVWGSLPGWTRNFFRVASTAYAQNRTAYGFSDIEGIAPFNNISYLRPNIKLTFEAIPIPIPQPIRFFIANDNGYPLDRIMIKVDDEIKITGPDGIVTFELPPGSYTFWASENGDEPFATQLFVVEENPVYFDLMHVRHYDVHFHVQNISGSEISDASVIMAGEKYEPGTYYIPNLRTGQYTYTISREGFFSVTDTMDIVNSDLEIRVALIVDDTSAPELNLTENFRIFPVPAKDHVDIMFNEAVGSLAIGLLNAQGMVIDKRALDQGIPPAGIVRFFTHDLLPGIYYLRIDFGYAVRVERIIIL